MSAFTWRLAVRYLRARWVSLVGVVGVTVAVWALIVVISVFSGFIREQRVRIRAGTPDMLVTSLPLDQSFQPLDDAIAGIPGVAAVSPRLEHYGIYYSRNSGPDRIRYGRPTGAETDEFNYVVLVGIDPDREDAVIGFGDWLQAARQRFAPEDPSRPFMVTPAAALRGLAMAGVRVPEAQGFTPSHAGIVLGQDRVAGERLYNGWQQGTLLDLLSARFPAGDGTGPAEPMSLKATFHLAGSYRSPHPTLEASTAFADIEVVRTMLGHDIDLPDSVDLVTSIAIRLLDDADPAMVQAALRNTLSPLAPGLEVLTAEEQNQVFLTAVDQERNMMKLVLFAVMLISGFLIYSTINMMVVQKTRDIGILGAMGASARAIQQVFLTTGLLVGLTGCTVGGVIGTLTAIYLPEIDQWMKENLGFALFPTDIYVLDTIPVQLEAGWVIQVLLAAFTLCLLVAWLPARAAARLRPVQALSHD